MIRTPLMLAMGFVFLLTCEASGIWVFESWVSAIPMMMIVGFLVLQRVGVAEGVAWFCVLALLRGDIVAGTIALIGPSLTSRVFSTRSLYALLGIGLVSHAVGILVLLAVHGALSAIFHVSWNIQYGTLWLQELLLIPGLYLGTSGIWWFDRTIGSRVALKSLT